MNQHKTFARQVTVAVMCIVGAVGSYKCVTMKTCFCGHRLGGGAETLSHWLNHTFGWLGVIGTFGIIAAGVIAIRGGFPLAKITGVICLLMVAVMFMPPSSHVGTLASLPLVVLGAFHLVTALYLQDKKVAEQVAASDR